MIRLGLFHALKCKIMGSVYSYSIESTYNGNLQYMQDCHEWVGRKMTGLHIFWNPKYLGIKLSECCCSNLLKPRVQSALSFSITLNGHITVTILGIRGLIESTLHTVLTHALQTQSTNIDCCVIASCVRMVTSSAVRAAIQ